MLSASDRRRVLFLCTGNACRSQMAEGWTRALHGATLEPLSAGTDPHGLDPRAIRVMAEAGVDIAGQESKHLDRFLATPIDAVVTVCGKVERNCPAFAGPTIRIHVPFDDPPSLARAGVPEEEILALYRRVRDEIRFFVESLPDRLEAGKD